MKELIPTVMSWKKKEEFSRLMMAVSFRNRAAVEDSGADAGIDEQIANLDRKIILRSDMKTAALKFAFELSDEDLDGMDYRLCEKALADWLELNQDPEAEKNSKKVQELLVQVSK